MLFSTGNYAGGLSAIQLKNNAQMCMFHSRPLTAGAVTAWILTKAAAAFWGRSQLAVSLSVELRVKTPV